MEINHRIQDKFLSDKYTLWIEFPDGTKRKTDYNEVELILKDIRFIRHELTNYSYLYSSQLSFGNHLNKNYWEFLNLKGKIGQNDRDELEEGVLLIIYLFFSEIFEREGWSFIQQNKLTETIALFIDYYKPENQKKKKLKDCIDFSIANQQNEKLGSHSIEEPSKLDLKLQNQLAENDKWIYKKFIENYFVDIANSFEPLRQKTKSFFDSIMKKREK